MNTTPTLQTPASPVWTLGRGQTLQLPATRVARWLRLREGRLWVTADGRSDGPMPEDWWLEPGECLRLPAGTSALAEGWAPTSFELLEEARA